jgi:hypothetical protein
VRDRVVDASDAMKKVSETSLLIARKRAYKTERTDGQLNIS